MNKKLVAYFSVGGTTAAVAKNLAAAIGADLYEIKPKIPYTNTDVDWTNRNSRSSLEMRDKTYRPELADANADIAAYDLIFLGFPIWWYVAPTIVNTFLESYDFSGKKIVLFATSGGSGFGKTKAELQRSAEGAVFAEGKILNGRPSINELKIFAEQY